MERYVTPQSKITKLHIRPKTTVINIRKAALKKLGYRDLLHWLENPDHVYIGRNMEFYVPGAKKSKWCNPFSVTRYGLDECLRLYRTYITQNDELMQSLHELKGKTLGCWCDDKCHGHVLVELIKLNVSI